MQTCATPGRLHRVFQEAAAWTAALVVAGAGVSSSRADRRAPDAQPGVKISRQGDGVTVTVEIGDLSAPRRIVLPEESTVVFKRTAKPKQVFVYSFGVFCERERGDDRDSLSEEKPIDTDEDVSYECRRSARTEYETKTPAPLELVLVDRTTQLGPTQAVYGPPLENQELLAERALAPRIVERVPLTQRTGESVPSAGRFRADLARLFGTIDERYFVWVKRRAECAKRLGESEPLLVYDKGSGPNHVVLLRPSGELVKCYERDFEAITTRRPESVVVPVPAPQNTWDLPANFPGSFFGGDAFLGGETDAEIATLRGHIAAAKACSDREYARLDPDHRASHYDVVSQTKVESLSRVLWRKVTATCHLEQITAERNKIHEKEAKLQHLKAQQVAELTAKRFGGTVEGATSAPEPRRSQK